MSTQIEMELVQVQQVPPVEIVLSLQDLAFQMIRSGVKKFEYRRRWRAGPCVAFIYRSGKIKGVAARMFLGEPIYGSPGEIGELAEKAITGNGRAVEEYLQKTGGGYAIPIKKFEEFPIVTLAELRNVGFNPPQFFFYLRSGKLKELLDQRASASASGFTGSRIAATVGQSTCSTQSLVQLADAGACMFRYNLAARLGFDVHRQRIDAFRQARATSQQEMLLMLDLPLPGAKWRVGMLPEPRHLITTGTVLKFRTGTETQDILDHIPVLAPHLGTRVTLNQVVTVGDGELALRVLEIHDEDSFSALALTTANLPCQKSLNLGRIELTDLADHGAILDFVAESRPDYIALSFVETVEAASQVFDALAQRGLRRSEYRAIAKIETATGVANAQTLATVFEMIMVARGDLALNVDFSYLGELQEHLINQARAVGKECMVATNVCESIATSGVPNRAELVGMYALAKQKVDFILLAKETSSLPNPIRSVKVLRDVILAASRPMFP